MLFGQPELDVNLARNEIRQLRDRITHSFSLGPMRIDDVHKYLSFRLRAAGYRGPELFSPEIARQMARASQGLTRRINILADKTLLAAFADGTHNIKKKHLDAAAADSEFAAGTGFRWRIALMAATCLIVAAMAWVGYRALNDTKAPGNATAAPPTSRNTQPAVAAPAPSQPAPSALSTPAVNANSANSRAEAFSDPLESRLSATHEWLAKTPGNLLGIQLLGSNDLGFELAPV